MRLLDQSHDIFLYTSRDLFGKCVSSCNLCAVILYLLICTHKHKVCLNHKLRTPSGLSNFRCVFQKNLLFFYLFCPHHFSRFDDYPPRNQQVGRYRNWNPPLLGNLPDDFLRILPQQSETIQVDLQMTRIQIKAKYHAFRSRFKDKFNNPPSKFTRVIDHFTRCKQHWSRNTSCFSL